METYWGKNGTRTRVVENILKPDGNRINAQVDYEYDNLYRLKHEHRIDDPNVQNADAGVEYEHNFAYDAAGNRTQWQVVGGSTTNYTYDVANKMTAPGTFTYDDKGNTTQIVNGGVTTQYTWDLLNRMTQWAKTGQTTQSYVYNADGMRVRITPTGGTATNFLLAGREIVEETTGANVKSYIGPRFLTQISGTNRTTYLFDGIGSTRASTDGDESVVEAGIYDAYGNLKAEYPASSAPNYGFAGKHRYYSDVTGLHYLKVRYYDPAAGRFISRDPVGYLSGFNMYTYVRNCPTSRIDSSGMWDDPLDPVSSSPILGDCLNRIAKCFPEYKGAIDAVGDQWFVDTRAEEGDGEAWADPWPWWTVIFNPNEERWKYREKQPGNLCKTVLHELTHVKHGKFGKIIDVYREAWDPEAIEREAMALWEQRKDCMCH